MIIPHTLFFVRKAVFELEQIRKSSFKTIWHNFMEFVYEDGHRNTRNEANSHALEM